MNGRESKLIFQASLEEIKKEIERKYREEANVHFFISQTFEILRDNPFDEKTVSFLLKEGWKLEDSGHFESNCSYENKIINIQGELVRQGHICDFYERDLALMHELNHAWYGRFKVIPYGFGQRCLDDATWAVHAFENRLINEYVSRVNRTNPQILKAAVEGFGLEPQKYDLASYAAFDNNRRAKISPLAKKNRDLLNEVLTKGCDAHYCGPLFG